MAQCDHTETYQISSSALAEAMLESPTLCQQLLNSMTDPLILISNREHDASSRLLTVLSRDMQRMRKPIPNAPSDLTWFEDAMVGSVAQGLASSVVGALFERRISVSRHLRVGLVNGVHEAVRSILYHNVIHIAPQDAAMPLVAASLSGFFTVPFRFIAARKTEAIRSPEAIISDGLRMAGVSWLPVFSQSLFLGLRRKYERYAFYYHGTPTPLSGVGALLLACIVRAFAALCFFPIASRISGFGRLECAKRLRVFILKQLFGLLIQVAVVKILKQYIQCPRTRACTMK
eukprot:GDKK01059233.1.p1 GENE.GDKK01059233.1~~GDKK01059233.1.p1  ORF type:complete len:310 (+),score=-15.49 GDKK01059233.1:66-932(+)